MAESQDLTSSTPPPLGQPLPRVAIQFCTQCKWMLRAAYFAQELLSTFSTSLGEVALIPATGGIFTVTITTPSAASTTGTDTKLLWDRKTEGGFPETKELKRRVRDVIEPGRDLGHVDRHSKVDDATAARVSQAKANKGEQSVSNIDGESLKAQFGKAAGAAPVQQDTGDKPACEDCA